MEKFMSRKFIITLIALVGVLAIGVVWVTQSMNDVGLWGLWFAALGTIVGIYGAANVAAKKQEK
jgi:hypothetical protein